MLTSVNRLSVTRYLTACCVDPLCSWFPDRKDSLTAVFSPCRSSWLNQQGDPNPPRARRTLMRTTETDAPITPNAHTKRFLLVYLKLNSLIYFVEMTSYWLTWKSNVRMALFAFLFLFYVPNKRPLGCYAFVWILFLLLSRSDMIWVVWSFNL